MAETIRAVDASDDELLDRIVALIASEQQQRDRQVVYVGEQPTGIRAELDDLDPPWTSTVRIFERDGDPVGVTLAAQLGVAPVQLLAFGPLPLASIPANLLPGPVAGPVMVWGLPAGLGAGLAPDWLAHLLHLPTQAGVRWIHLVAQLGQAAPLPSVGWADLLVALCCCGLAMAVRARRRPRGSTR